jgi:hypothetical protein
MASTKKIETVALFLTPEEASLLSVVMSRIGGSPEKTPRIHADRISEALYHAGYKWQQSKFYAGVHGSMKCSGKTGTRDEVGHVE